MGPIPGIVDRLPAMLADLKPGFLRFVLPRLIRRFYALAETYRLDGIGVKPRNLSDCRVRIVLGPELPDYAFLLLCDSDIFACHGYLLPLKCMTLIIVSFCVVAGDYTCLWLFVNPLYASFLPS